MWGRGRGLLRLGGVGVGVCRWGLWRGLGGFWMLVEWSGRR